jgi:enoyl-CoA hydratase
MMETSVAAAQCDLIIGREGGAGIIRLNRPKALNAMTFEMSKGIDAALDLFEADPSVAVVVLEGAGERGLCAGGDIRGLYESAKVGGDLGKLFWRQEYIMNARIAKYPKPYVAFMDGLVMGGGVGLSAHGRHRVVTERTKLAMPEVGLGFFPDVGGTWLLSHAPGEVGSYFGLTGQTMNGPDAVYAGFADAVMPSGKLAELREALTRAAPGTPSSEVCDRRDSRPGRCARATHRPVVRLRPHGGHRRRIEARRLGAGAGHAQDAGRKIAAWHGGDVEAASARARRGFAGGVPGARISRRAGSVPQR